MPRHDPARHRPVMFRPRGAPYARFAGLLLVLFLWLAAGSARAGTLRLDTPPDGPLGLSATVLAEPSPLGIAEARARFAQGQFRASSQTVPDFGIGAGPVWLHLSLENPTNAALARTLVVGTTWIDHLDVYLVRHDTIVASRRAGDAEPGRQHPVPGIGYVFSHDFAPGRTDVYIRAATPDPLSLPLLLMTPDAFTAHERSRHYGYGLVYGFMLALLAYNLLLYIGMRARSHLDYAIYLGCFLLMNMAYTGHGYGWLWPAAGEFQRWVILVTMVLFSCTGLRFARHFLDLPALAPGLSRATRLFCAVSLPLMALAVVTGRQTEAALLSFTFMLLFVASMFAMGILGVLRRQGAARYFLAAVSWGMVGTAITTLGVWGVLPYNALTFHAFEIGMLTEATLLALAVAHQVRVHQQARELAEHLARIDPLTGLPNRRAFGDQAERIWQETLKARKPLSLLVLDLDHFKSVNDIHGRMAGDEALQYVATLLADTCRRGDLLARWGGEEFILLLPGTTLDQALGLAERIRRQVAASPFSVNGRRVILSASLGVATRDRHASLDALVGEADGWLLRAKRGGRDRVCGPYAATGGAARA